MSLFTKEAKGLYKLIVYGGFLIILSLFASAVITFIPSALIYAFIVLFRIDVHFLVIWGTLTLFGSFTVFMTPKKQR